MKTFAVVTSLIITVFSFYLTFAFVGVYFMYDVPLLPTLCMVFGIWSGTFLILNTIIDSCREVHNHNVNYK